MASVTEMTSSYTAETGYQDAEEGGEVVLLTTVDIGDGKSDTITFRKGDRAEDVARAFCDRHGLPPTIVGPLANHIMENLHASQQQQQQHAAQATVPYPRSNRLQSMQQSEAGVLTHSKPLHSMGGSIYKQTRSHSAQLPNEDRLRSASASASASNTMVYNRLYDLASERQRKLEEKQRVQEEEALRKLENSRVRASFISQEMMRERGAQYGNYGEMLYNESLEAMRAREEKSRRAKEELESRELTEATFHPHVTRLAQELWSSHEGGAPAWKRLSQSSKNKTAERLEMLRKEKEEAETKECSFKPRINNRSDKMMGERVEALKTLRLTAHEQLFQDAMRRQQKQQEYEHWYPEEVTFKPQLVTDPRMSTEFLHRSWERVAGSTDSQAARPGIVERLYASHDKLKAKLEEARAKMSGPVDPETGRTLYKPETGRAPAFQRVPEGKSIGEYLYTLKGDYDSKKNQMKEEELKKQHDSANQAYASKRSQALIDQLKAKRFKQIFEFLDEAGTGRVALLHILKASEDPELAARLDELDDEVRQDLENAAKAYQHLAARRYKKQDSTLSTMSLGSMFMPPPSQDLLQLAASGARLQAAVQEPSSPDSPGLVDLDTFCKCMDEAVSKRRGPRAYLAPSPPPKYMPTDTFQPNINEKSKALATKLRPPDVPAHELMYAEAQVFEEKKEEMRRAASEAELKECTFAPKLNPNPNLKEGRVMQSVRASRASSVRSKSTSPSRVMSVEPSQEVMRYRAHTGAATAVAPPAAPMHQATTLLDQQQLAVMQAEVQQLLLGGKPEARPAGARKPSAKASSHQVQEDQTEELLQQVTQTMQKSQEVLARSASGRIPSRQPSRTASTHADALPLPAVAAAVAGSELGSGLSDLAAGLAAWDPAAPEQLGQHLEQ